MSCWVCRSQVIRFRSWNGSKTTNLSMKTVGLFSLNSTSHINFRPVAAVLSFRMWSTGQNEAVPKKGTNIENYVKVEGQKWFYQFKIGQKRSHSQNSLCQYCLGQFPFSEIIFISIVIRSPVPVHENSSVSGRESIFDSCCELVNTSREESWLRSLVSLECRHWERTAPTLIRLKASFLKLDGS